MKNLKINQNLQYFSALGFYENGISLVKMISENTGNKALEIAPVAAVNVSFAAELLLKLICHLDTTKTIHEHKLNKIFQSLDKDLQQEIEKKYNENKLDSTNDLKTIKLAFNTEENNPEDQTSNFDINDLVLDDLLNIHSEGFVKWRYAYEVENKYYSYEFNFNLMNEFIKALLFIIEMKTKDVKA